MAVSKSNNENDQSYINPLLQSPKKQHSSSSSKLNTPRFFIFSIFVFGFLCMFKMPNFSEHPPCGTQENSSISSEKDREVGLDSTLSKDLPSHLQNPPCKLGFHGNKVTERMTGKGPYLRMEKDVQYVDSDRSSIERQKKGIGHGLSNYHFNRSVFPPKFLFGAGSSAYQYEGAAFEGGKGQSIWDTFTHKFPGKILDGSNGDMAENFYNLYKEDVKLGKYIGLDAFRMSISWPRILPRITPFVTLFHWDVPQALEDEYRGFLKPHIIDDFRDFVELCFKEFGDRIKHWITMNEPFIFANGGYDGELLGNMAPGRCSSREKCFQGNSSTEPYIVAHHLLLCHAATVKLYKEKYQPIQTGEIGITLVTHWFVPYQAVGSMLKLHNEPLILCMDALDINNVSIGEPTGMRAFFVYPKGLYKLLVYTKEIYKSPTIYITENGIADSSNGTVKHAIEDLQRIKFYSGHFRTVQEAINQGVNVKGFFAWSFLDTFEWRSGYTLRFGLYYVDYKNGFKRVLKQSAAWLKICLSNK
ncbi:UNVERIFIED_CONTAM: Beta-glucosidase 12 [Sesamum calycinum]|uniref:Beta-glucosidase 12 n=1 Tax=Sesamum calycinum TaxID=2727403 RepID=A0AAW2IRJ4_9LAMI